MSAPRKKLVFCLRVRVSGLYDWSEPEYYLTRKERDRASAESRILCGIHTHSYEEKKTLAEMARIFSEG